MQFTNKQITASHTPQVSVEWRAAELHTPLFHSKMAKILANQWSSLELLRMRHQRQFCAICWGQAELLSMLKCIQRCRIICRSKTFIYTYVTAKSVNGISHESYFKKQIFIILHSQNISEFAYNFQFCFQVSRVKI